MTELKNYIQDGANYQARAVLMLIQGLLDEDCDSYTTVARWENCREQGYVISASNKSYKNHLNICFFVHRNSDGLCSVKWFQRTINSPTIDTAKFIGIGNKPVYKDKFDTSHESRYLECVDMAKWIVKELTQFINEEGDYDLEMLEGLE